MKEDGETERKRTSLASKNPSTLLD